MLTFPQLQKKLKDLVGKNVWDDRRIKIYRPGKCSLSAIVIKDATLIELGPYWAANEIEVLATRLIPYFGGKEIDTFYYAKFNGTVHRFNNRNSAISFKIKYFNQLSLYEEKLPNPSEYIVDMTNETLWK